MKRRWAIGKTGRKETTMSANVETMFSVREKPWHYELTKGKTRLIQEALTSEEALKVAGLDWEVQGRKIYDCLGKEIPGYIANTRTSDDKVLGIVTGRYKVVQNQEAFDFTDALIGEGIKYETAGSLRGGRTIWLLGKMPERYIAGDKFEPYICFTNTHDGSGAVRACMNPVRVVCNNTLNIALRGARRTWSTCHKGNMQKKLDEARHTLELAEVYMQRLDEEADKLANEKFSEAEAEAAIDKLFPLAPNATERQKRTAQDAKDQIMVCMVSPDLVKFMGTKWGFVNAVSDYIGHGDPARHTKSFEENRWCSIIGGHPLLDAAMHMVGAR